MRGLPGEPVGKRIDQFMTWRSFLQEGIAIMVLVIISISIVTEAQGAPVTVIVRQDAVTLTIQLDLMENLTSLPMININVLHSNSTSVVGPINAGIRKLTPGASIQDLSLRARTLNNSGTWHLQENYTVVVTGAILNPGSTTIANLAFLSMNVSDPITVGNQELNRVGDGYLMDPLMKEAALSEAGLLKVGWFIDGSKTLTATIPEVTTRSFSLLDLSWIPQVSLWTQSRDILGQSTSWSYTPELPRYNLTYGQLSPEQTLLKSYVAVYDPSFSMSISSIAFANGSTIQFDTFSPIEYTMPFIIASAFVVLVVAFILDRRYTKQALPRRKKR
jgi:hypothetical protein